MRSNDANESYFCRPADEAETLADLTARSGKLGATLKAGRRPRAGAAMRIDSADGIAGRRDGPARRHGARAESYPSHPVRMLVPFGAGGPGDIFARLIAQKLTEQLGQQFFVDNRPGAGGTIGTGQAARAAPDGYTLLVGSSTVWVNASLYPQLPYDPVKDFDPIIIAATSPEVLIVHPSVPAKNVQELIALVRAGKYTNFAMPGAGTPPHLSTELFKLSLHLDFVDGAVRWRRADGAVGGRRPYADRVLVAAAGIGADPRRACCGALAVTSAKRVSQLPDVPTLAEAGVPGQDQEAPQGLWAPAGTPTRDHRASSTARSPRRWRHRR